MTFLVRRLVLLLAGLALIAALWRLVTTGTQSFLLVSLEIIVLIVVGLVCLWLELRSARSLRR